jgi:hypothetical protein
MTLQELSECNGFDVIVDLDGNPNALAILVFNSGDRPYLQWPPPNPNIGDWPTNPKLQLSNLDIASFRIASNQTLLSLIKLDSNIMARIN